MRPGHVPPRVIEELNRELDRAIDFDREDGAIACRLCGEALVQVAHTAIARAGTAEAVQLHLMLRHDWMEIRLGIIERYWPEKL